MTAAVATAQEREDVPTNEDIAEACRAAAVYRDLRYGLSWRRGIKLAAYDEAISHDTSARAAQK